MGSSSLFSDFSFSNLKKIAILCVWILKWFFVRALIKRFILITTYLIAGLWLAFPISYFFQDTLYDQISWLDYIKGGADSILMAAQFGALTVYRKTAISCIIVVFFIAMLIEKYTNKI